jgi:hypothetical protein
VLLTKTYAWSLTSNQPSSGFFFVLERSSPKRTCFIFPEAYNSHYKKLLQEQRYASYYKDSTTSSTATTSASQSSTKCEHHKTETPTGRTP